MYVETIVARIFFYLLQLSVPKLDKQKTAKNAIYLEKSRVMKNVDIRKMVHVSKKVLFC